MLVELKLMKPQNTMSTIEDNASHKVKSRIVSYRISQDQWQEAEIVAALANQNVSDFARVQLLESCTHSYGLSPGLQLLMTEMQAVRRLITTLIDFVVTDSPFDHNSYLDALDESEEARWIRLHEYFQGGGKEQIDIIRQDDLPSDFSNKLEDQPRSTEPPSASANERENELLIAEQLSLYQ